MASNVVQNVDGAVNEQQPDVASLQNGSSMIRIVSDWVRSLLLLLPRGLRRKVFSRRMAQWLGRSGSHTGGPGVTAGGGALTAVRRLLGLRHSSSSNLPGLLERSISNDGGPGLPVSAATTNAPVDTAAALQAAGGSEPAGLQDIQYEGEPYAEGDAMLQWLRAHGGVVNMVIRQAPGRGRFLLAGKNFTSGDLLASIPFKLCYLANDEGTNHLQGSAIRLAQMDLRELWQQRRHKLQHALGADVPLDDMTYTVSLPAMDMLNHRNGCPNRSIKETCKPGSSDQCIKWFAQEDVKAGKEVCFNYKRVRFCKQSPVAQVPWSCITLNASGTPEMIIAEMERLRKLQQDMRDFDSKAVKVVAATAVKKGDTLAAIPVRLAYRIRTGTDRLADHVEGVQAALRRVWDSSRVHYEADDSSRTFGELQHSMDVLTSKLMLFEDVGWVLLPLMSLAPHVNNCPHTEHITTCPAPAGSVAAANQTCVVWVAGSDLAAGDQVCTNYAYLTPDRWEIAPDAASPM
eukprot:gene3736-3997_t